MEGERMDKKPLPNGEMTSKEKPAATRAKKALPQAGTPENTI